jgi:hypothetical protein
MRARGYEVIEFPVQVAVVIVVMALDQAATAVVLVLGLVQPLQANQ